jgi:hypothetical protein
MARHGGDHIIKTEEQVGVYEDTGTPRMNYTFWCGETSGIKYHVTRQAGERRTCPACSAAFAGAWNQAFPNGYTLGAMDRALKDALGMRGAYPVLDAAGQQVGAICTPHGFGKGWQIHIFGTDIDEDDGDAVTASIRSWPLKWEDEPAEGRTWARSHSMTGFPSKEFALSKVPDLEAGAGRRL